MTREALTYAKAGVSIEAGDAFVERISPLCKKTRRPEVLASVGGFAAMAKLPKKYRNPIVVVATDGVGTKILLAKELKRFDTVGIDLVAMSVNDLLTLGAEPFLFLDYYATGKLNVEEAVAVVRGIATGCKASGCALVGGETAEMPSLYQEGDFDLAGFCLGVLERGRTVDGSTIRQGDIIVGLPSSGIHSNGFSLVRAILQNSNLDLLESYPETGKKTLGDLLLEPTRIYVPMILRLLNIVRVKGMAHITGGGLPGNVVRIIPKGLSVELSSASWKVPSLFRFLQEKGQVSENEMFQTFNMGIGFALVLDPKDVTKAKRRLPGSRVIGKIVRKSKANPDFKIV